MQTDVRASESVTGRLRSITSGAIPLALLSALVWAVYAQAEATPTIALDEPLWFMRSRVPPTDLSTEESRLWAIDVPGVNRWVYWAMLNATGLDEIPAGEARPWSVRNGTIHWYGGAMDDVWRKWYFDTYNIDWWERNMGPYAPRRAIMAMRMVNIATFAVCMALLWWTAWTILRSKALAVLAVAPIALSSSFITPRGVSFVVWSGDVFMAAAMAGSLGAWVHYHLRGQATTWRAIIITGALAGFAAGAKQTGILAVAAFALYLAWYSEGWRRALNPLLAAAAAGAVIIITNPVAVLYPDALPWDVGLMVLARRAYITERYVMSQGPCSIADLFTNSYFWWPFVPAGAVAVWACRKEKWFAPVAFWGAFVGFGAAAALLEMRMPEERYSVPVQMGVYFAMSLSVITTARRHMGTAPEPPGAHEAAREPESAVSGRG